MHVYTLDLGVLCQDAFCVNATVKIYQLALQNTMQRGIWIRTPRLFLGGSGGMLPQKSLSHAPPFFVISAWNFSIKIIKFIKYFLEYTPALQRLYDHTPVWAFLKYIHVQAFLTYIEFTPMSLHDGPVARGLIRQKYYSKGNYFIEFPSGVYCKLYIILKHSWILRRNRWKFFRQNNFLFRHCYDNLVLFFLCGKLCELESPATEG